MMKQGFSLSISRRTITLVGLVLTTALVGACGSDNPTTTTPQPPRGILVLDGFIQPGLTFLGDTGTASTKLALGPSTEFDAGGFTLERDTVLAVSSRGAGDLLYITDVRASTFRRLQLPPRSNPSRARLFRGSNGQSLIAAALRDSSAIALVAVTGAGTPAITRIPNAGLCPTDMFQYDNATWVVDANANCKANYAVQGDVRLIRIPNTGTTRDTINVTGMRGSGASALVIGDVAYLSAGGDASFASFPYTLLATGSVARIDLRNRRVQLTRQMPAGSYGAGTKLGLDGFLYVSLYENLSAFAGRILKVRADDLSFVTNGATPFLDLKSAAGAAVNCGSGQADAFGRLHCIQNGTGSVTSLVVFSPAFQEVRRVLAGQGGVDMALRP
ncbi:hypothetical protein GEMMAAP_08045 [Gemmatimonas phototrophica]|uniref:Uncharacterized protein n=1 Tax=Gemmatimonas phototrophica TaxID=1379270 RepID=A0A143BIE4_9BACT|nr:hypothetical protein GEMMAAP_08045 [Gemmatimonas phototrophica]